MKKLICTICLVAAIFGGIHFLPEPLGLGIVSAQNVKSSKDKKTENKIDSTVEILSPTPSITLSPSPIVSPSPPLLEISPPSVLIETSPVIPDVQISLPPGQVLIDETSKDLDNSNQNIAENNLEHQKEKIEIINENLIPLSSNKNRDDSSEETRQHNNSQEQIQTPVLKRVIDRVIMPTVEVFSRPIYTAAYKNDRLTERASASLISLATVLLLLGSTLLGVPRMIAHTHYKKIGRYITPFRNSSGVIYEG